MNRKSCIETSVAEKVGWGVSGVGSKLGVKMQNYGFYKHSELRLYMCNCLHLSLYHEGTIFFLCQIQVNAVISVLQCLSVKVNLLASHT